MPHFFNAVIRSPFFGEGDVPQGRGNAVGSDDRRRLVDDQLLHLFRLDGFVTRNFQSGKNQF